ncbi:hypothetical protein [Flammeovirga aprica]|uniref:DUF4815 domain-containing protein n=1 Tax=Flammeovirga aprica JL-4 TaxID=694437 RepID=A0A7X9RVF3_9BACT|nr:hypothetical protein [Flammeovirga aprica]NME69427.1 hypothetical protein [Flammeovirga aprica JL-4]
MNYSWKNWKSIAIASSFLFAGLIGCNKEYSEQDFLNDQANLAQQDALLQDSLAKARVMDSLKTNGYLIDYTVKVVSANETSFTNSNNRSLDTHSGSNAIVTFIQGDSLATVTANEQGFAFFANVKPGVATVNVELADHTPVSMNLEFLSPEALSMAGPFSTVDSAYTWSDVDTMWVPNITDRTDVIQYRHASTIIPVFNVSDSLGTSVISGNAVYVSNTITAARTAVPDGVRISASIDVTDSRFYTRYLDNFQEDFVTRYYDEKNQDEDGEPQEDLIGDIQFQDYLSPRILKAAYEGALSSTTTSGGMYSLRVPTAINGLPIRMQFSDFSADQEIALNKRVGEVEDNPRVETFSTIFTSNPLQNGSTNWDGENTDIPNVPGATIEIAAPPASGSGATLSTMIVPRSLTTGAWLNDPTRNSGENRDLVTITAEGSGYTGGENENALDVALNVSGVNAFARVEGPVDNIAIIKQANKKTFDWDGGDDLNDYFQVSYEQKSVTGIRPTKHIESELIYTANFEGKVKSIQSVTYAGTGYTSVPAVTISGGNGSGATAEAVMSGEVDTIRVTNGGSGYLYSMGIPTVTLKTNALDNLDPSGMPIDEASVAGSQMNGTFTKVTISDGNGGAGYSPAFKSNTTVVVKALGKKYTGGFDFDIQGPLENYQASTASGKKELEYGFGYSYTGAPGTLVSALDDADKPSVTITSDVNSKTPELNITNIPHARVRSFTTTAAWTVGQPSATYYIEIKNASNERTGLFKVTSSSTNEIAAGTFSSNLLEVPYTNSEIQSMDMTSINILDSVLNDLGTPQLSSDVSTVTYEGGLKIENPSGSDVLAVDNGLYSAEPTITVSTAPSGDAVDNLAVTYKAYINGKISNLRITSGGSYNYGVYYNEFTGDIVTSDQGVSVTFETVGSKNYKGYTGSNSDASVTSFDLASTVSMIFVDPNDKGENYTIAPTVVIHPIQGETSATGEADLCYKVSKIKITNGGSGYTDIPTVTIAAPPAGSYNTTAYVEQSEIVLNGLVSGFTVDYPGYYYIPSGSDANYQGYVKITSNNVETTGFEAMANLNGKVTGIYVASSNGNYTEAPTITITGGNGTGATATWSTFGSRYQFMVDNAGSGYFFKPNVLEYTSQAVDVASGDIGDLQNHSNDFEVVGGELRLDDNGTAEVMSVGYYTAAPSVVIESKQPTAPVATALISGGEITGFNVSSGAGGTGYDPSTPPAITVTSIGAVTSEATLSWIASEFYNLNGNIDPANYDSDELLIDGGAGYRSNANSISETSFKVVGGNVNNSGTEVPGNPSTNLSIVSLMVEPGVDKKIDVDYGTGRRVVGIE